MKHSDVTRHIHVTLDDDEFERAEAGKGEHRTWAEAVMQEIAEGQSEAKRWD